MSIDDPRPYQVDPGPAARDFVQDSRDRWKYRRYMIFGAAVLLGFLLIALTFTGGDASKFEATVWAFVSLVGIYIGAPVADDWLQSRPGIARA